MTEIDIDDLAMELVEPPQPAKIENMPKKATASEESALADRIDQRRFLGLLPPKPSIELAAARFSENCVGGGYFCNNCAHYLSNAFILAGFKGLLRRHRFIEARCYRRREPSCPGCDPAAKRPVRAREMEKWFAFKATTKKNLSNTAGDTVEERYEKIKNTGFWAVFQRDTDPGGYWGGHVCIIDTDNWNYYGTGYDGYWDWKLQHIYKW